MPAHRIPHLRPSLAAAAISGALLLGGLSAIQPAAATSPPVPKTLERVSITPDGKQAVSAGGNSAVSADGRYVAFVASTSPGNLEPSDLQIYVRDRTTGSTKLVSAARDGSPSEGFADRPDISADGRYVVFESDAHDLVSGDSNGRHDIFVRDLHSGTTRLVSVAADGGSADGDSSDPVISANGRYVGFASSAADLVAGDTDRFEDAFVRDLGTDTTQRVMRTGAWAATGDAFPDVDDISANGRYVLYTRTPDLADPFADAPRARLYLVDRLTGGQRGVAVARGGRVPNGYSRGGSLSADGRFVAFESGASNLVPGDTNRKADVFVRDMTSKATGRVSVRADGKQVTGGRSHSPAISADSRRVAFVSEAKDLRGARTGAGWDNVFVRNRTAGGTTWLTRAPNGHSPVNNSQEPAISANGRVVSFDTNADNLVPRDANGQGLDVLAAVDRLQAW